eukprot:TRINITY_DN7035_c0_g1_i6.p1 TRINITY_DN7035_c0_g1~~TRINITY_DN7035_c0_g1_i6.p1  ORF type:complete len:394 (+),score=150.17 TRINITY_DN7035_c0_g1_i6:412-1593(+)
MKYSAEDFQANLFEKTKAKLKCVLCLQRVEQQQLREMEAMIKERVDRLRRYEEEEEKRRAELTAKKAAMKERRPQLMEYWTLKKQIAEAKTALEGRISERDSLKAEVDGSARGVGLKEAAVRALDEIVKLHRERDETEGSLRDVEAEIHRVRDANPDIDRSVASIRGRDERTLNQELSNIKANLDAAIAQKSQINTELKEKERLRVEYAEVLAQYAHLPAKRDKRDELSAMLKSTKEELVKLRRRREELSRVQEDRMSGFEDTHRELLMRRSTLSVYYEELKQKSQRYFQLKEQDAGRSKDRDRKEKLLKNLQTEVATKQERIKENKKEIELINEELGDREEKFAIFKNNLRLKDIQEEIDRLEKSLKQIEADITIKSANLGMNFLAKNAKIV